MEKFFYRYLILPGIDNQEKIKFTPLPLHGLVLPYAFYIVDSLVQGHWMDLVPVPQIKVLAHSEKIEIQPSQDSPASALPSNDSSLIAQFIIQKNIAPVDQIRDEYPTTLSIR
jgi:hypothetical protein